MYWDGVASLILISIIIQSIFVPISLAYYVKVIQPNKHQLFWKIRRPKYFLFYILITLLVDMMRCTSGLLVHVRVITPYWYSLLSVPLAYFSGITWGTIRLWLLFYDIKFARKSQLFLLSKYLNTHTNDIVSNKQKPYKSVTMKVFGAVIVFCVITILLDVAFGLVDMSKLLLYSFILLVLSFFTYFLFKLGGCCGCRCCKSKSNADDSLASSPFRDDWLLLLELTIIWIMWIIGLFGALLFLPLRGQPIYPVLIAFLTMATRVAITLTMLIVPYKVSLRLHKSNAKTITISALKNVLSTKSYFYSFVEHLVQELAIENLTVLVEIWQFKYEQKYKLKPLKISKKRNEDSEKSQEKSSTVGEWHREVTPTIDYEDTCNILQLKTGNSALSDGRKAVQFLEALPWKRLPLAQSIASNLGRKWPQCGMIYAKYFDEQSYDEVNVSYATRYKVTGRYFALFHYKQKEHINGGLIMDPETIENNQTIANDAQFKERIPKVFDSAIDDILFNLRDSLTRFVSSDGFKLAH